MACLLVPKPSKIKKALVIEEEENLDLLKAAQSAITALSGLKRSGSRRKPSG